MHKNRNLLILVVLLGALAIYAVLRNTNSTIRQELRNFDVQDTAAISKIFLADRGGKSILLTRKNNNDWRLNDSLIPRPDVLKHLLDVIFGVRVKTNIPKPGYNNVIRDLATGGVKCEIYLRSGTKAERVYYIGGETQDALGTYMMLENSNMPFITEIPGFNGYLTPRYSTRLDDWKLPVIFNYARDSIRSITVSYPAFPDRSFELEHNGPFNRVVHIATGQPVLHVDSIAVENYLSLYKGVFYEKPDYLLNISQRDSMLHADHLMEITVRDATGKITRLTIYPMPLNDASLIRQDTLGQPLRYDVDRMYGYLHASKEWVVVQHFNLDHLFRLPQDFDLDYTQRKQKTH